VVAAVALLVADEDRRRGRTGDRPFGSNPACPLARRFHNGRASDNRPAGTPNRRRHSEDPAMTANPVSYIEIPVKDLDRATAFYTAVFGFELERANVDGYEMALFPHAEGRPGASGALVKGDVYEPSKAGAIVYFSVADIDKTLTLATENGAQVLYPKKDIGDQGFVAEIEDSEGNRIAFHQSTGTR